MNAKTITLEDVRRIVEEYTAAGYDGNIFLLVNGEALEIEKD